MDTTDTTKPGGDAKQTPPTDTNPTVPATGGDTGTPTTTPDPVVAPTDPNPTVPATGGDTNKPTGTADTTGTGGDDISGGATTPPAA